MRRLAMLRSIQAFEAAARHASYTGAATELNVTAAAVGQQVRALEAWLGTTLFRRLSTGSQRLVLTDAARAALVNFRDGLDRLDAGLQALRQHRTRAVVTVSASQGVVSRWLLPRLEQFSARHPSIDVRLDVSDRLVDVERGLADVAIRCGPGSWGSLTAIKLMDEQVFPACAPALLERLGMPQSAHDLSALPLVHDISSTRTDVFPSWSIWLAAQGVPGPTVEKGLRINSPNAVLQAALAGQGVALVRQAFVVQDIQAGRLIRLFPEVNWPIPWGYNIVFLGANVPGEPRAAFVNWVVSQAQY